MPNEKLLDWMIRIIDAGASGIQIDQQDALKFITVSTNQFVQMAIHYHQHTQDMTFLLPSETRRCIGQYPSNSSWPTEIKPWYTLRDGIYRLKGESMKTAIMIRATDQYLAGSLTAPQYNVVVWTAPSAYKNLIMTLLLAETGNPVEQILEKNG